MAMLRPGCYRLSIRHEAKHAAANGTLPRIKEDPRPGCVHVRAFVSYTRTHPRREKEKGGERRRVAMAATLIFPTTLHLRSPDFHPDPIVSKTRPPTFVRVHG